MRGAFDDARRLYARSLGIYEELGLRLPAAGVTQVGGEVELLAGDPAAAERELRRGYAVLEPIGVTAYQAVLLAAALYEQGRHDEAARYLEASERSRQRREAKVLAGGLRAKLEASRGRAQRAEATARQVVLLADSTDALNLRAGARLDLASVFQLLGRADAAAPAIHEALDLYRRKGNATSAARAAAQLGAPIA